MTILLVEHDMDFVMGLTDRLVVMDFGEKLAEGLPAEIQRNPRGARGLPGRRVTAIAHERTLLEFATCMSPTARSRRARRFATSRRARSSP